MSVVDNESLINEGILDWESDASLPYAKIWFNGRSIDRVLLLSFSDEICVKEMPSGERPVFMLSYPVDVHFEDGTILNRHSSKSPVFMTEKLKPVSNPYSIINHFDAWFQHELMRLEKR